MPQLICDWDDVEDNTPDEAINWEGLAINQLKPNFRVNTQAGVIGKLHAGYVPTDDDYDAVEELVEYFSYTYCGTLQ